MSHHVVRRARCAVGLQGRARASDTLQPCLPPPCVVALPPRKTTMKKTSDKSAGKAPAKSGKRPVATSGDELSAHGDAVQALVASMPYNTNKPLEFGRENAVSPPRGAAAPKADPAATASTLSEVNRSQKTGDSPPPEGLNRTIAPLDRV